MPDFKNKTTVQKYGGFIFVLWLYLTYGVMLEWVQGQKRGARLDLALRFVPTSRGATARSVAQ